MEACNHFQTPKLLKYKNHSDTFPVIIGYWFSVTFHHICQLTASSGVRFFYFTVPSTSLSHFFSGLPLLFLPSNNQLNSHLGDLLSPNHNTRTNHFNMLFSILMRTICVAPFFFSSYFTSYF
jgi:hypothetical protein